MDQHDIQQHDIEQHDTSVSSLPTVDELVALGRTITSDGLAAHEAALADIVELIRRAGVQTSTVDLLADRDAPEVARMRALSSLTNRWRWLRDEIEERRRFESALDSLRAAWLRHEELRHSGAASGELWRSRAELDRLRLDTARTRRKAFCDA